MWAKFELAMLLHFAGSREDARLLAADTLAEIKRWSREDRPVAHASLDPICEGQLEVIAHGKSGAVAALRRLQLIDGDKMQRNGVRWLNFAKGMAHEELGHVREAIDCYEVSLALPYAWPQYPQYHFDDRLIELLDQTDQLERGRQIFSNALETRRKDLPDQHPIIGLTQLRLADVLIRGGAQAERAEELLQKARETMSLHKTTPQHVFDRIDRLTKQANAS